MILTRLMNMERHVISIILSEYSQLEIYDYNDHSGFVADYEMTSNSELVDMTLRLEFLYIPKMAIR